MHLLVVLAAFAVAAVTPYLDALPRGGDAELAQLLNEAAPQPEDGDEA
jgi:hypothetical protein